MRKISKMFAVATLTAIITFGLSGCGLLHLNGAPGNLIDAKQATQSVESDLAHAVPDGNIANIVNVDQSPLVACNKSGYYQWVGSATVNLQTGTDSWNPLNINTYVVNYAKSHGWNYVAISNEQTQVLSPTAGTFYTGFTGNTFQVNSASVCFPFKPVPGKTY